jgi:glycosyltransferase involved in cell wall biosynthesis
MKRKSLYLLQEPACLNPRSGAFQHISIGYEELSKSFDMKIFLNTKKIDLEKIKHEAEKKKEINTQIKPHKFAKTKLYGTLKDIQAILKAIINIPKLHKLYKREQIQFVYERTAYIDFSGLVAAKITGKKHFYEANGIQFIGKQKYYRSYLTPLIKGLEKWMYKKSNHTFFVGTYGFYWNLKTKNWSNIENGIEKSNLNKYEPKKIKESIDICFIGRLMSHHKFEILIEGLNQLESDKLINLHIIGAGFDQMKKELKSSKYKVYEHGFLSRKDLKSLINDFQIGIIAGSPEHTSNMKLFDYASGGCAVIAPEIENFKYWFNDELCFFDGSAIDLADKIQTLFNNEELLNNYGLKLHNKIKNEFTWDKIYGNVADTMSKYLDKTH